MRQSVKHYSGLDWYLSRIKRMPRKYSRPAVVQFIIGLSNNPVPMPIDRALDLFEKARQSGAIAQVSQNSWQGNPNWAP